MMLLVIALVAGCKDSKPHVKCSDDTQCTLAGRPGVCVDSSCATHDTTCPSGLRYDVASGGSGECVLTGLTVDMATGGNGPDMATECSHDSDCINGGQLCGGVCSMGRCVYAGPTTDCGSDCTGAIQTTKQCDGRGACVVTATKQCEAYACDTTIKACRTSCMTGDDCNGVPCLNNVCGSCPDDMVYVAPATFLFSKAGLPSGTPPPVKITLTKGYCIDKTEVSVASYRACVKAGVCAVPTGLGSDSIYGTYTDTPSANDSLPINNVNWDQATTYCTWAGLAGGARRLPTEVEWERAARGVDGRTYPWGETSPDCSYLTMTYIANSKANACVQTFTAVGTLPKGMAPSGIFDASGNVAEWTQDCATDAGTGECAADCTDPTPPTACSINKADNKPDMHIVRGGANGNTPDNQVTWQRFVAQPGFTHMSSIGIRCAK
jgi:formylglycine-generating enzyme required for sulfatase activity